jgi:hypothetical protein
MKIQKDAVHCLNMYRLMLSINRRAVLALVGTILVNLEYKSSNHVVNSSFDEILTQIMPSIEFMPSWYHNPLLDCRVIFDTVSFPID